MIYILNIADQSSIQFNEAFFPLDDFCRVAGVGEGDEHLHRELLQVVSS